MPDPSRRQALAAVGAALALAGTDVAPARAETLSGRPLVEALRHGGCVIVMRHAHAPPTPPPPAEADPGNPGHERQLDAAGRRSAAVMGLAIRRLRLPIGEVWSSPTYRARETIRLAGLTTPKIAPELGDQGVSMQAIAADPAAWLRAKASEPPRPGTDTVLVTHAPNMTAAFGPLASGLKDGEALVFRPGADRKLDLIGRIEIEAWPLLAKQR